MQAGLSPLGEVAGDPDAVGRAAKVGIDPVLACRGGGGVIQNALNSGHEGTAEEGTRGEGGLQTVLLTPTQKGILLSWNRCKGRASQGDQGPAAHSSLARREITGLFSPSR